MFNRILCIFLTLTLVFCLAFECTLNSSAVVVADDALVIASVFLACAGAGLTVYTWSEFFQGDTWHHFCSDVAGDISTGFQSIVRQGKQYVSIAAVKWAHICNWIKSKFAGKSGDVDIEIEVPTHPDSITLGDGTVVPWAGWMDKPFFIYRVPSSQNVWGVYCSGLEPAVNFQNNGRLMRVLCKGRGETHLIQFVDGTWTNDTIRNMTYGLTYKGVTGSFVDINLPSVTGNTVGNAMQYRTMPKTNDAGTPQEQEPPNAIVPSEGVTHIQGKIDANKVPGAIDSPAVEIAEGEQILIEVPNTFLETDTPVGGEVADITTDIPRLVDAVNTLNPSDTKPAVLTQPGTVAGTVDGIIADTPVAEIPGNADVDIDTANKFRLPQSFLEGFPFSIPYSIYIGLKSFIAEPVAPRFEIPFSIPRLGINEGVVLDLEQFSPLARLCRALLSLVWVAGLAMACSKFIKR